MGGWLALTWLAKVRGWLIGAGAVLVALAAAYFRGKQDADQRHEFEDAEAYRETRKRMDEVDIDDAGAAREWLHQRQNK